MSIMSDQILLNHIKIGNIKIDPFRPECLGPNGYDIHLGNILMKYDNYSDFLDKETNIIYNNVLDCKDNLNNSVVHMPIPKTGLVIFPNELYLGSSVEYTEAFSKVVPFINGKSSLGRLGVFIHVTAGQGDAGFRGHWTLELVCVRPIRIYPNMPIGQITYHLVEGEVTTPYNKKNTSKYNNKEKLPMPSQMWRNWDPKLNEWIG